MYGFGYGYTPLSMQELMSWEMPAREWIVEGLIPAGSLSLLSGREKSGKSLFLMDLVCSVAHGEHFLGRSTVAGPAALVFLEDHPGDVRERMKLRVQGDRYDAPLYFLPADGSLSEVRFSLTDDESMNQLTRMITCHRISLLAIDPLRETHDLAENDADQMAPIIRPLRQVAHHQNKSGESRGSTAIRASVDQELHWSVDEEGETLQGKLRIVGRCGPRQVIHATFGEHGRFETRGHLEGADQAAVTRQRILEALRGQEQGMDASELMTALEQDGKPSRALRTILTAVSALEKDGVVMTRGAGVRGEPRRFSLAEDCRRAGSLEDGDGGTLPDADGAVQPPLSLRPTAGNPGLPCYTCGERPATDGWSFCEECRPSWFDDPAEEPSEEHAA